MTTTCCCLCGGGVVSREGVQRWIWEEVRQTADNKFRFLSKVRHHHHHHHYKTLPAPYSSGSG